MTNLALVDIDGVLANDEHRLPYALRKEWADYFDIERMFADVPLQEGRDLVKRLVDEGYEVQYLTGRREDRRAVTTLWLLTNGFPVLPLHMRHREDERILSAFKRDRIRDMKDTGEFDTIVLFEDDSEVVRVVNEEFGEGHGVLCEWYTKHPDMIRRAES